MYGCGVEKGSVLFIIGVSIFVLSEQILRFVVHLS